MKDKKKSKSSDAFDETLHLFFFLWGFSHFGAISF